MGVHGLIVAIVLAGFVGIVLVESWRFQREKDIQANRKRDHARLMREISRHGE